MIILLRLFRRLYRIPAIILWALVNGIYAHTHIFFKNRVARVALQTQIWGAGLLVIFGIKLRLHGEKPSSRETAGLIVSNHTGYVDILTEAAAFGLRFTPKKEIRSWPILGYYVHLSQPVWIDRTSPRKSMETLEQFRDTLRMKVPLIVYPEGTSSDGRSGLKPFKSTSFETVVGTDLPIHPVLLFYRTGKHDTSPAWYGGMTLLPHLWKILGNGRVYCDLYLLPPYTAPKDADRKQIMNEVRELMVKEYDRILAEIQQEESSGK